MYRTGAATHMQGQVTTDTNLGKTLDDTMHKAERAREDVWFREHDLVNLRELYKKARMQAKHMEGEAVKTDAAELKELELLVEGKLDQATMERLIDWKHHHCTPEHEMDDTTACTAVNHPSSSKSRDASSSPRSSSVMAFIAAASFAACNLAARSSGCDALSFSISTHSSSFAHGLLFVVASSSLSMRNTTTCCRNSSLSARVSPHTGLALKPFLLNARYNASSKPCPPHRPHVCAIAILPSLLVTSPPTAGAFMCDSIWARHRAKASAPSAEYTKSEPHTKSHWRSRSPSTLNPSTSFQSNALAFSPDDEVPSVDALWPRDRLRRRRSNAPPSFVSVAVHD